MKISVLILSLVLFSVITHSVKGQDSTINTEDSSIILSEATITSIANLFYKYKKEHLATYTIEEVKKADSILYLKHDSLLELSLLQQEAEVLETKNTQKNIAQLNKKKYQLTDKIKIDSTVVSAASIYPNDLSSELSLLKQEIEALKTKKTYQNTTPLNKKTHQLTDRIKIDSTVVSAASIYPNDLSSELSLLRQEIATLKYQIIDHNTTPLNKEFDINASSDALKRDLNNLEYEIAELKRKTKYKSNIPLNTTVIVSKSEAEKNESVHDLTALQKQLDSLFAISNAKTEIIKDSTDYADKFSSLKLKLQELQANIASTNANQTNYSILKGQYKDFNKQIFFANNSVALQLEASKVMQEVYSVLDKYENIDVLIKGYASNKGLPSINEKLSMQRTETVKKGLVLKGIHPSRILTQYHGIDYDTTSENDARRVDITLVIRK